LKPNDLKGDYSDDGEGEASDKVQQMDHKEISRLEAVEWSVLDTQAKMQRRHTNLTPRQRQLTD
jgi:hypothetical protein